MDTNMWNITVEDLVICLFRADRSKSISLERLYQFVAFMKKKFNGTLPFRCDINSEVIRRLVYFNDDIYELLGNEDILVVKGILPTLEQEDEVIQELADEFSQLYER